VGCPNIYVFFAVLGAIMYSCIATTTNIYVFEIAILTIISLYGGFFSAMPSYLKTIFTNKYLSTIHGRILFAWGLAGIIYPTALSFCKDLTDTYTPMFYVFIAMMLINLVLLWDLRKDITNKES
jgi:OFA family oxalate/formate antiporter-like MFS transporter